MLGATVFSRVDDIVLSRFDWWLHSVFAAQIFLLNSGARIRCDRSNCDQSAQKRNEGSWHGEQWGGRDSSNPGTTSQEDKAAIVACGRWEWWEKHTLNHTHTHTLWWEKCWPGDLVCQQGEFYVSTALKQHKMLFPLCLGRLYVDGHLGSWFMASWRGFVCGHLGGDGGATGCRVEQGCF